EHLSKPMNVQGFMDFLVRQIDGALGCVPYTFTPEDLTAIARLREERFGNPAWNFGASPAYRFSNVRKFPAGLLEAHFDVRKGRISGLKIFGDYFFQRPTEGFCAQLEGCPYEHTEIAGRLSEVATGEYFTGISPEELLSLLI
ncbi:MAG: hypothetical protein IJL93_07155, partial [Bacteroidales bacterium]|nr:hypothetical protein [Bacteroidales bacterium]